MPLGGGAGRAADATCFPPGPQVSILDYQSTQLRLLPLLATCYGLHFARGLLVDKYVDMKRTKDPKLVEEVVGGRGREGRLWRCAVCGLLALQHLRIAV